MAPAPSGTSTVVTVKLSNAAPGGRHPWAVHWGQCGGMDDGVFGAADAYKMLEVEANGDAKGTATLPVQSPTTGNYFVVVRASATNRETIVACGNFAPPTG